MSGIKAEYRNDVAPSGLTPQTQDDSGVETPIGEYCAGSRVGIRCRRAEAFINNTTTGGGGVSLQWEGPFIRIRPHWGSGNLNLRRSPMPLSQKSSRGVIAQKADTYSMTEAPGTIQVFGSQGIYYDIDLYGQSSIYLPFDASLSIFQVRAGIVICDAWEIPPEHSAPVSYKQEFTQTRFARTAQTRRVTVPFGAQEMSFFGSPDPAGGEIVLDQEDTGKTVGGGSTQISLDMMASGSDGKRIPCGGIRTVQLGPTLGQLGVTFYIGL